MNDKSVHKNVFIVCNTMMKGETHCDSRLCENRFGDETAAVDKHGFSQQSYVWAVNRSICSQ